MTWSGNHLSGSRGLMARSILGTAMLALVGYAPAPSVQGETVVPEADPLPSSVAALVFDGVTVVDVEQGKLVPGRRVVVVDNRIQAVGKADAVKVPSGAQVIDARGKYLIPGLWDLHVHPRRSAHLFYPLFVANGVTGIRDAGSEVRIDTLFLWRREILAGTRVGPPRQIISGQSIAGPQAGCNRDRLNSSPETCVTDSADAVYYVDSIAKAGADMIKPRAVSKALYFIIAAESRRLGKPFGGHAHSQGMTASELSDSGAKILEHGGIAGMGTPCWGATAKVEDCQPLADQLRRNDTWFVPTLAREGGSGGARAEVISAYFTERAVEYWAGTLRSGNWLRDSASAETAAAPDSGRAMSVMRRVNLPMLAGTDAGAPVLRSLPPGFALHAELAMYVAEGLTPLDALRMATINPAKMLHGTDSLGTVAPGKLADLILLDADPLADITNTTTIRAVVANGRYYDRAALDLLLLDVRAGNIPTP